MKRSLLGLTLVIVAFLAACAGANKDAEVKAFITDTDKLAADIVRTAGENPSGVDKAQKILDERKTELKNSFIKLKDVREYQLSKGMTEKLTDSVTKNVEAVNGLQLKYVEETASDAKLAAKLKKLSDDFTSIYDV